MCFKLNYSEWKGRVLYYGTGIYYLYNLFYAKNMHFSCFRKSFFPRPKFLRQKFNTGLAPEEASFPSNWTFSSSNNKISYFPFLSFFSSYQQHSFYKHKKVLTITENHHSNAWHSSIQKTNSFLVSFSKRTLLLPYPMVTFVGVGTYLCPDL